jgi:hypothetical protein
MQNGAGSLKSSSIPLITIARCKSPCVHRCLDFKGAAIMKTTTENCQLCLGPHDDEIHDATLNIHIWLREEIARKIAPFTPSDGTRSSGN